MKFKLSRLRQAGDVPMGEGAEEEGVIAIGDRGPARRGLIGDWGK